MQFSRLMLGTVQFGLAYGINNQLGKPEPERIEQILRVAADCGVNVLDTARNYGDSEEQIAAALRKTGLQQHFKIITKIAGFPDGLAPAEREAWVERSVMASLTALQRDHVEGLLFHHESALDCLPLLQKYQERGLTLFTGISLDSNLTRDIEPLAATQIPGNILDRRFVRYAQRAAKQHSLIFVRSVYLQGLLFKPEEQLHPTFKEKLLPVRRKLENLAWEAGLKPPELYFRYLLSNPDFTCILSGVDSPEQLRENLRIVQAGALPEDLLQKIHGIVPELPEELIRPSNWPR